jgi:hypothetical protein
MSKRRKNSTWWTVLVAAACVGVAPPSEGSAKTNQPPFAAVSCAVSHARESAAGSVAVRSVAISTVRSGAVSPAAQVTRNDRADITFEIRPASAGGVEVRGRRGDLLMKKTVQPTGDSVLELADGHETVTVAISAQGTRVTRKGTTVMLGRATPDDAAEARVRRLLAESSVVVRFRAATAALLEANDVTAPAVAMLIADATVGMLTGDVGAPRRIAEHLARRGRSSVRQAGMALDCYTVMEQRMVEAYDDFGSCYYSTAYNSFYQSLCSWRWTLQVESYWFSFISCTGFNM